MDNLEGVGSGPYEVTERAGCYTVRRDGQVAAGPYGARKTANRKARELNLAHAGEAAPLEFLDDGPVISEPNPDPENPAEDLGPKPKKGRTPRPKPIARTTTIPGFAPAPSPKPKKAPKPKPGPEEPASRPPFAFTEGAVYTGTREEWLNDFVAAARPNFKAWGLELPEKIRVSVGFMFRGGKAIGQCWHKEASTDETREIFIIPTLDDSLRIADVLTHELAHTLFGPDEKHGKNFKAAVTKLGLEGKATATVAGDGWREWAEPIIADLGPIPHARLDPLLSGVKKQKTYLIKASCTHCDVIFRITAKAANGKTLRCVDADCDGLVTLEGAEDLGEGDGE